jgi:LPS-assembly lipoprotein
MLTACGFTPLYATRGEQASSVPSQFNDVAIANIPDQSGQYLRNALMDRLYSAGRPANPRYTLTVAPITEGETDLDITKSSTATRTQLRLTTSMTLTETATGKTVLTRDLAVVNSYNVLESQFTTRVTEQNTRQSSLDNIARQIEAQLALFFNSR